MTRILDKICGKGPCEVVLFVAIAAWIVFRMLSKSMFGSVFVENLVLSPDFIRHRVLLLCVFCELCCVWRREYNRRDVFAFVVLGCAGCCLYLHGFVDAFYDVLLVFVARHYGFKRILGFATVVVGILAFVVAISSLVGLIPDVVLEQEGRERPRHCLGFTYCLFPAQYLFAITCSLCLLRDRKMHWASIVVLFVLNVACLLLTWSRLSFGLAALVLVFSVMRKLPVSDIFWIKAARAASWCFIGVAAVSVLAVGLYASQVFLGGELMKGVDAFTGERIRFAYEGLVSFGVSPFGQEVTWIGNGLDFYGNKGAGKYNYVDNLFFHSLIEFGWVYTVALFAFYTVATRKMVGEKWYLAAVVYGVLALHFLFDDLCLMLDFNIMLFVLGPYLFQNLDTSIEW